MNRLQRYWRVLSAVMVLSFLAACSGHGEPNVKLSFHMVSEHSNSPNAMAVAVDKGIYPPGTTYVKEIGGGGLLIDERSRITEACIKSAEAAAHPTTNNPIVKFQFDSICTGLFAKMTQENIGRQFAIVLNDEIVSTPRINGPIMGGGGFLESDFTETQVRDLVRSLNTTFPSLKQ